MRKSIFMGLGLALSLAGVAAAQQPGTDAPKRDRGQDHRGSGGRFEGRGGGFLLKDITLTDAQKAQVKQLHESQKAKMDANRDAMKKQFDEARAARERGDTTAARAIMQRNRDAMEAARSQEVAALRNILTADQRVQFDKNVAEMKQRQAERGKRVGQDGQRDGRHGGKDGKPGRQG
jgi:Spy/CpxP family protein refolding chaperone